MEIGPVDVRRQKPEVTANGTTGVVAAAVVEGFVCDVRVVVLCQAISAVVADVDGQTCDCVAVDSTERAARVLPDHRIAEVACQVATTHG
eukprot:SAG31_NODE_8707_length_1402_cov_1.185725_2_plen_90_part_00